MTTRFACKLQSTILFGTVLFISACASFNSADSGKSDPTIARQANDTTSTTIQKGKFENPPEMQMSHMRTANETAKSASASAPDTSHTTEVNTARINQKEASVNVRSAPSAKSRSITILKAGQDIEVLDTKDNWIKITWQKGNSAKQGWINKAFVEDK